MVEKNREIKLTNRDNGTVGYTIPDLNLHRTFSGGETKTITFEELEKLAWVKGGLNLLKNYLIIQDEEAVKELLGDVEPEYYYTKDTVRTLLKDGSLEQLQDTLEFAPKGVVDLVKDEAVDMPLNDVAKRKEILKQTHFDVDGAIKAREAYSKKDENEEEDKPKRRANPVIISSNEKTRKSTPIIIKK